MYNQQQPQLDSRGGIAGFFTQAPAGPTPLRTTCLLLHSRGADALATTSTNAATLASKGYKLAVAEIAVARPLDGVTDLEFAALCFPQQMVNVHEHFGNNRLLLYNLSTALPAPSPSPTEIRVPNGIYHSVAEMVDAVNSALAGCTHEPSLQTLKFAFADGAQSTTTNLKLLHVNNEPLSSDFPWVVAGNPRFGGLAEMLGLVSATDPYTLATLQVSDTAITSIRLSALAGNGNGGLLPCPARLRLFDQLVVHVEDFQTSCEPPRNRIQHESQQTLAVSSLYFGGSTAPSVLAQGDCAVALCPLDATLGSAADASTSNFVFLVDPTGKGNATSVRKHFPHPTATQYNQHTMHRLRISVTNELMQPMIIPANAYFSVTLRVTQRS